MLIVADKSRMYLADRLEGSVPLDGDVNLDPGFRGQRRSSRRLHVEVERVLFRIWVKSFNAGKVRLVGVQEVGP